MRRELVLLAENAAAAAKLREHVQTKAPLVVGECRPLIDLAAFVQDTPLASPSEPLDGFLGEGRLELESVGG